MAGGLPFFCPRVWRAGRNESLFSFSVRVVLCFCSYGVILPPFQVATLMVYMFSPPFPLFHDHYNYYDGMDDDSVFSCASGLGWRP